MKFDIPKKCEIRWQAALAVLEDIQEDKSANFDQGVWADSGTQWNHSCNSPACFAGFISVAPYCQALGSPDNYGRSVQDWLTNDAGDICTDAGNELHEKLFDGGINKGSRAKTLAYLQKTIKQIFKESTGKALKAPLTFYIDA